MRSRHLSRPSLSRHSTKNSPPTFKPGRGGWGARSFASHLENMGYPLESRVAASEELAGVGLLHDPCRLGRRKPLHRDHDAIAAAAIDQVEGIDVDPTVAAGELVEEDRRVAPGGEANVQELVELKQGHCLKA